jgi:hypothetical protein
VKKLTIVFIVDNLLIRQWLRGVDSSKKMYIAATKQPILTQIKKRFHNEEIFFDNPVRSNDSARIADHGTDISTPVGTSRQFRSASEYQWPSGVALL